MTSAFGDQSFHTIGNYLKKRFGCKVIKLSLDAGFTCPNRDGTKGIGGCIFCSADGSGDFASDIPSQIRLLSKKWPSGKYIAYFQSHTNTYAPVEVLREKYEEALKYPDVIGIAIATRPDCLSSEILELLSELNKKTFLWVELGLQTIHDTTAEMINRCYPLSSFDRAVDELSGLSIKTVVHLILGLPGETREDMLSSVRYVCSKEIFGIKLHLMNVLEASVEKDRFVTHDPVADRAAGGVHGRSPRSPGGIPRWRAGRGAGPGVGYPVHGATAKGPTSPGARPAASSAPATACLPSGSASWT